MALQPEYRESVFVPSESPQGWVWRCLGFAAPLVHSSQRCWRLRQTADLNCPWPVLLLDWLWAKTQHTLHFPTQPKRMWKQKLFYTKLQLGLIYHFGKLIPGWRSFSCYFTSFCCPNEEFIKSILRISPDVIQNIRTHFYHIILLY